LNAKQSGAIPHADRRAQLCGASSTRSSPAIAASLIERWGHPQSGRVLADPGLIDVGHPLATGTLVSRGIGVSADIAGDLGIQNLGDRDIELCFNSVTTMVRVPAGAHVHLARVKMWPLEWIEFKGVGNGSNLPFVWAWSYVRPD
jgi:hypothetical protein